MNKFKPATAAMLVVVLLEACFAQRRQLDMDECNYGNHFYSDTTGQCEECDYGKFYSPTLDQCLDCDTRCMYLCAYMDNCFECPSNQYLDLDTMECVDECDITSTVAINDTQFDNRLFCRGFNYYVNPDSESVVEFGTKLHPYKDIGYVFVELLNYHSHSDRNITVNVKENTTNYLILSKNYIMNTTFVKISPYSSDPDAVSDKATLVDVNSGELERKIGTSFNIMKFFEIRLDDVILNNDGITDTEKGYVSLSSFIIAAFRCNFMIDNMEFLTEYSSSLHKHTFLFFGWIQDRLITMTNQHWRTSGEIMISHDPLNMYMENIDVDYYRNFVGMMFLTQCNYPEAYTDGLFYAKNVTFYYADERVAVPVENANFYYTGPADYVVINFVSLTWSYSNEAFSQLAVNSRPFCNPDIDRNRYLNYTNLYFELLEQSGSSANLIAGFFTSDDYRLNIVLMENLTVENCENSLYPPLILDGNSNVEITIKDSYVSKSSSFYALYVFTLYRKVVFENLVIEKSDSFAQFTIAILYAQEVEFNNVTLIDCDFTGTDPTSIFYFIIYDGGSIIVTDFSIIDSNLAYRSGFEPLPLGSLSLAMSNLYFENVTLNTDTSLVRTGAVNSFTLTDSTFTNVKQVDANDNSNTMIELGALNLDNGNDFVLANLTAQQSSIALIEMNSVDVSSNTTSKILFSDIVYKDSVFEYHQDLIKVGNIEQEYAFDIVLSQIEMFNLTFTRDGNLLKLEHQTFYGLQLIDSNFYDIYSGSIFLSAGNKQSESLMAKLMITNIFAERVGGKNSFLVIREGGELTVNDSVFGNSFNLESGAIILSQDQNAVAIVYNCSFQNNSALYGGVASIQDQAVIKFYNSTFKRNFAVQSGVIQISRDGYVQIYDCVINNNYAISAAVMELFITSSQSIISNSVISGNTVFSSEAVLNEFAECDYLCFLPDTFTEFYTLHSEQLNIRSIEYSIQSISSSLVVQDNSVFTNEPYLLSSYLSNVTIENVEITDIDSEGSVLRLTDSIVIVSNLSVTNLSTNINGIFLSTSAGTELEINRVTYSDSTMKAMRLFDTEVQLEEISFNSISLSTNIIQLFNCKSVSIEGLHFNQVVLSAAEAISFSSNHIDLIRTVTASKMDTTIFSFSDSTIVEMRDLIIHGSSKALQIVNSDAQLLHSSNFNGCGVSGSSSGGAILMKNSNSTISNNIFEGNFAEIGGAISLQCESYDKCSNTISNNVLTNNTASREGGAISYNFRRPRMSNNTFEGNIAEYGSNIASYAVRIVRCNDNDHNITFLNQGSGLHMATTLELCLMDYDNQTMALANSSQIKVLGVTPNAEVIGFDSAKTTLGKAKFEQLGFVYMPGSDSIKFKATSSSIDATKVSYLDLLTDNSITVSFRFCQPGEIVDGTTKCRECSAGSFSLTWNSTECHTCIDNAVCLGGYEIFVNSEYWRNDLNSTNIVSCPRPQSCKGGFSEFNEHPVECEDGYTSYLCTKCLVNGEVKFNRVSNYQCAKCPDIVLNTIRVIGVVILAFMFLTVLVVVTIRKKRENQTSILLRIMTNYLQLIAAALSLNLGFPNTLISLFSPVDNVGSASDTFLSFDCFFEDTEMKGFAPTTEILKVFLTGFLPLILICVYAIIWGVLYIVSKRLFGDFKRNLVISLVCIIFLLHMALTKSALSMFECLEVDKGKFRVRLNMDYECYSGKHFTWLLAIGLPNIIIWVVGAPVFAFMILFKHRSELDNDRVKRYYLILYQGYREEVFYWEFVNTIRKFLILAINTIFSFVPLTYRVLSSIMFLVLIIRIQLKLKPYRLPANGSNEIAATVSGTMALYCGLLFQDDQDENNGWLKAVAFIFLLIINILFILEWIYLFLVSLRSKHVIVVSFLRVYKFLICKGIDQDDIIFTNHDESPLPKSPSKPKAKKIAVKPIMRRRKKNVKLMDSVKLNRDKMKEKANELDASAQVNDTSKRYFDSSIYDSERESNRKFVEQRNDQEFSSILEDRKWPTIHPSLLGTNQNNENSKEMSSMNISSLIDGLIHKVENSHDPHKLD